MCVCAQFQGGVVVMVAAAVLNVLGQNAGEVLFTEFQRRTDR